MKKKTLKDSLTSDLRKGKVKGVGLFESIPLKFAGHIDGKRGLLGVQGENWISPRMEKEVRAYDEFASKMWGRLQIEENQDYARLEEIMKSVVHTKEDLEKAETNLGLALSQEASYDTSRKTGESRLTDAQVKARRLREKENRLSAFRDRVSSLQDKLDSEFEEFSKVRAKIVEDINSTRMVCNRVRDHIYQRLDVYWNAALLTHSGNTKMPVVPGVDIVFKAEAIYMEPHKAVLEKVELLNETLSKEKEEVA